MSPFNAFRFDHQKIVNSPTFLPQLSMFYCNIWRYDPNFGEFKQCPNCEHYFPFSYCVTEGKNTCSDCGAVLVEAWNENEVAETILKLLSLGENFFGAVALTPDISDTIIGFTWGFNKPLSEIVNETVLNYVNNPSGYSPYYSEFASDQSYRNQGIGSDLCRMLVSWMKDSSPNIPGHLRTHENSPARRIFEKAGFRKLCYDDKVGGGRIFMVVDQCKNLTPENL